MEVNNENARKIDLNEAIEKVLVESDLSIAAFARKVGYSRQYIYELLKTKGEESTRRIQLDTLKRICDATGYGLARLLSDIGYIPKPINDVIPNTVIVVNRNGQKTMYSLSERDASLIEEVAKSFSRPTTHLF